MQIHDFGVYSALGFSGMFDIVVWLKNTLALHYVRPKIQDGRRLCKPKINVNFNRMEVDS